MPGPRVALSVSWLTRAQGWVALAEPCGASQCMALYATTDAGRHWSRLVSPHPRIGWPVGGVLLADHDTGYMFSGRLFMTRDGGRHWARQPLPNVADLLRVGSSVVALTYGHGGCPGPCDVHVARAAVGSDSWTSTAPGRQSSYTTLAGSSGGVVAVEAGNRASASAKGALAVSTDSGVHWTQVADPCGERQGREYDLIDATAVGRTVTVLCGSHVGPERDFVATSADGGASWGAPDWLPADFPGHVTAFNDGRVIVTSAGTSGSGLSTYRVVASARPGAAWHQVLAADEPIYDQPDELAGISRLEPSSTSLLTYNSDGVHVWRSDDGGRSWQPLPLP